MVTIDVRHKVKDFAHWKQVFDGAAEARRAAGDTIGGPLVFHCEHRAWGVGMFDTAAVRSAGTTVLEAAAAGPCEFLVGTVSHCHGAFGRLVVGPAAEP